MRRLEAITEEYLRYARLPTPDQEAVDLVEILDGLSRFVAGEISDADIELRVDLPSSEPEFVIEGDRDQIRQALLNLVRNAKEALRESPPPNVLELTLQPLEQGGAMVTVQDNGAGISASLLEQIFDPFVTVQQHSH